MKAYCHECGEQIAPEDVFCPYCGIALQPLVQPSGAADSPLETTTQEDIPFAPPPIVIPTAETDFVEDDASLPPIPKDFDSNPSFSDNSLKKDTSERLHVKTEEVPEIQKHIPNDNADLEPIGKSFADETNEPESIEIEERKFSEPSAFPPVSSTEDLSLQEPSVGEIVGSDGDTESGNRTEEPNFDATIPYTPRDFAKNELRVSGSAEKESGEATSEKVAGIEIPKPEFSEKAAGENDKDDTEMTPTLISTPLPNFENKLEPPQNFAPVSSAAQPPQAEVSSEQENKQHTSPNVNSIDTGGKKTKLKTLSEGTVLNSRYEIVRKIGGGGMGAVYLASDRNLGGILRAVKEMVQSYIEEAQQEKAVNDFKRESLLLTSLEHPAIPTIFDYFYDDKEGRFYLVMKYISGGDLASRLRSAPEGRIDEKSVTEWAIQIADVLDYLHNRQPPIVYRDLKPSNIMIDGNTGKVMLIDFGIARWVNKEEKGVTAVGTMGYAPPELFSGNVESRSDIYSLGSTMFHLLTGADPQNNPLLIFDFHKHPRPRQINPTLSDQMEQILMRAVEYSAEKRFTSAREMRDVLNQHLQNLETGRVTFGAAERGAAVATSETQPVFCGFCGQKILANDMFCPFCGAKQPLAGAPTAPPASVAPMQYSAPKLTAKLYIVNTSELEAPVFRLEKDTSLIGRRDPMSNIFPEVDLSKFDPQTKISRRHARIWREGEKYLVEDLGSSNGTVLLMTTSESVRLLPQQPRILSHGDKLKLGDTTLHFVVG